MDLELEAIISELEQMGLDERIEALNEIRSKLHDVSPFKSEPVDLILWVPAVQVKANNYNPNKVASPEMTLLVDSVRADGFTQPIVTNPEDGVNTVVDGFHRMRVGTENDDINQRIHGYLPVTEINKSSSERMFSTIRHNRARGKHQVDLMGELVKKLSEGCTDDEIAAHLGMSYEELLRLKQTVGIAKVCRAPEYSKAWEIEK